MSVITIDSLADDRVRCYSHLTEKELALQEGEGLFIAESPKVIHVALDCGYEPISMLCEGRHIDGDAAGIIARCPGMPVYTGRREVLEQLTGYRLTRGVLCAMQRKVPAEVGDIIEGSRCVAVLEAVCDTTNIGSIFRSAAALGIDGILLTPDSCDPLNRRSIRVSMGTVFKIPWTFTTRPVEILKDYGYTTIAMTLHADSLPIDNQKLRNLDRVAIVLGTEGDGLSAQITAKCDYKAIIPMHHAVDSLNVGAAAAVAFWELTRNLKKRNK